VLCNRLQGKKARALTWLVTLSATRQLEMVK